jgi:ribosomal subunit interface protein
MNMETGMQITVRDVPHSEALDAKVRQKAAGLERLFGRLTACRVTVEAPHHHQRRGRHFCVRLDITVPGAEIVVNRDHSEDPYIALRDAFQAARRQLSEHFQRGQGADKSRRPGRRRAAPSDE